MRRKVRGADNVRFGEEQTLPDLFRPTIRVPFDLLRMHLNAVKKR